MSDVPQRRTLRSMTSARIVLGRTGSSLPLREVLALQTDHALARDAVHLPLDAESLLDWLKARGVPSLMAQSAAASREIYLRRPDLGRRLDADSRAHLALVDAGAPDLVVVVADGLSAAAVHRQAIPFLDAFLPHVATCGWRLAPLVIAREARVALGDEIAALLGARAVLVLIGERPGLSSPDSLGAYLSLIKAGAMTDADRNCVSNIRPEGLPPDMAADKVARLLAAAFQTGRTGVGLNDETEPLVLGLGSQDEG
ncbi:MAG: ethanolamine ammonia-lyase small subunit [Hyphomicrobiales bacterium]|nr:ethanolamine ammonia-lyase small subunit [Hyphomicrobiales bacterium]